MFITTVGGGMIASGLLGGLMSRGQKSGGGETKSEPWAPAQPYILDNLKSGQQLRDYYRQNPFNDQQKTSYQNLFGDIDNFRQNTAPGLMNFSNNMMQSKYERGAPKGLLQQPQGGGGLLSGGAPTDPMDMRYRGSDTSQQPGMPPGMLGRIQQSRGDSLADMQYAGEGGLSRAGGLGGLGGILAGSSDRSNYPTGLGVNTDDDFGRPTQGPRPGDPQDPRYDAWAASSGRGMAQIGGGPQQPPGMPPGMPAQQNRGPIEQLYQSNLGRAPEAAGKAYWENKFGDSISPAEAQEFAAAARPEQQVGLLQGRPFGANPGQRYGQIDFNAQNPWRNGGIPEPVTQAPAVAPASAGGWVYPGYDGGAGV